MGIRANLKLGDKVLLSNGKYGIIIKTEIKELDEPETTYNFEVADFHTYYVGTQGILVHNRACIWDDITPTGPNYPNSNIPTSFKIRVDGDEFWVAPNATKHMEQFISTNYTNSPIRGLAEQQLLQSFQGSIRSAVSNGISYQTMIASGNWQLGFSAIQRTGPLVTIYHAVYFH